jgi:hypothetical protein
MKFPRVGSAGKFLFTMHTTDKKILLIIPYFGKLPWYFRYFVHSCKSNPGIHFLIITDDRSYEEKLPDNIFMVYQTFHELKKTIARKLKMDIALQRTYKLCDFRPAYGIIFNDYIKEYAFWGHCDIDLVFGNIGNFVTDDVLQENDVISIRPEYISGFFALYRNTESMNNLFRLSKDHLKIFSVEQYMGFDECGLLCDQLMEGSNLDELDCPIESMTHLVMKQCTIKAYFDLHAVESVPGQLKWINGELYYMDAYEILLYHLVSFKVHPNLTIPTWKHIPGSFFINEYSFSQNE